MIRHSRFLVIAVLFVGFCATGSFAQQDRSGVQVLGQAIRTAQAAENYSRTVRKLVAQNYGTEFQQRGRNFWHEAL